ncbi:transposase [Isosphaeraceae bacterium EP7]
MTLSRVVRQTLVGVIGLPLLARLYVRKADVPKLPELAKILFRTKLRQAAEMLTAMASGLPKSDHRPRVVVDGAYANREFLKPAFMAGFDVVARLRKDAALTDLPPVLAPGTKRARGRPPIYGKNVVSLAKRAGQKRGWAELKSTTASGREVTECFKTFLATWRPAGEVIRG